MNITKQQLKDLVASAIKSQVKQNKQNVNEAKTQLTRHELKKMVKEAMEKVMAEETKDEHNYEEFFRAKMKEMFGTESLDDLSAKDRKKFFSAVDHDWKAKNESMDEQSGDDQTARWHAYLKKCFKEEYGKEFEEGYDELSSEERRAFLRNCRADFKSMDEGRGMCEQCGMSEAKCECNEDGEMCEKCGEKHDEMSECGAEYTKTTVMESSAFQKMVLNMISEELSLLKQ